MMRAGTRPVVSYGSELCVISAVAITSGAGAVTSVQAAGGSVSSCSAIATGQYKFLLARSYGALVACEPTIKAASGDYHVQVIAHDVTHSTTPYITVGVFESKGETATDAAYSGAYPHTLGTTPTFITAADATDLATLKTLCLDLCTQVEAHDDDTNLHITADTGNLAVAAWASTPAAPADLAECQSVVTEIKADWNAHIAKVAVAGGDIHAGADARAVVVEADGTDLATSITLANELKVRINRSLQAKPRAAAAKAAATAEVHLWAVVAFSGE